MSNGEIQPSNQFHLILSSFIASQRVFSSLQSTLSLLSDPPSPSSSPLPPPPLQPCSSISLRGELSNLNLSTAAASWNQLGSLRLHLQRHSFTWIFTAPIRVSIGCGRFLTAPFRENVRAMAMSESPRGVLLLVMTWSLFEQEPNSSSSSR